MNETLIKRPPWRVTFEGSFWHHPPRARAGQVLPLEKTFSWAGREWVLPAVYLCGQGVVLDLCMKAEPEEVRAFLDKWGPKEHRLTSLDLTLLQAEHPLHMDLSPRLTINGKAVKYQGGMSVGWYPHYDRNDRESLWLLEHYGLDPDKGWSVHRYRFPWATKRRPRRLSSLALALIPDPVPLPGPQFTVESPGQRLSFVHPVTGQTHTLTVEEYAPQGEGDNREDNGLVYPTHSMALTYRLDPNLLQDQVSLQDCAEGDKPYPKEPDPMAPQASCGVMLLPLPKDPGLHAAASSLYFQPPETVLWQMFLWDKRFQICTIPIR